MAAKFDGHGAGKALQKERYNKQSPQQSTTWKLQKTCEITQAYLRHLNAYPHRLVRSDPKLYAWVWIHSHRIRPFRMVFPFHDGNHLRIGQNALFHRTNAINGTLEWGNMVHLFTNDICTTVLLLVSLFRAYTGTSVAKYLPKNTHSAMWYPCIVNNSRASKYRLL